MSTTYLPVTDIYRESPPVPSDADLRALVLAAQFISERGCAPTYRELATLITGSGAQAVGAYRVQRFETYGWVSFLRINGHRAARSMRLTDKGKAALAALQKGHDGIRFS